MKNNKTKNGNDTVDDKDLPLTRQEIIQFYIKVIMIYVIIVGNNGG